MNDTICPPTFEAEGYNEPKENCSSVYPRDPTPLYCDGGIRLRTLARLHSTFSTYGHKPSQRQWKALSDLASVMEGMADETTLPVYFLSSLDPGVGKTQTIGQGLREIVEAQRYDNAKYQGTDREGDEYAADRLSRYADVGCVVFLSRLEEVRALADAIAAWGISPAPFAVLSSDKELNQRGLGSDRVNDAQILLTTQQRLEKATIHGSMFKECPQFFYKAKPRQVRVWDESLVPGRGIVLDRYAIASLLEPLSKTYPELRDAMEAIFDDLKGLPDGNSYVMPDFVTEHGVSDYEVLSTLPPGQGNLVETIQSLWFLSGRKVGIRRDMTNKVIIDCRNFLPEDLAPLLILDASGRVRTTYKLWEDRKGGIIRLADGHKRYDDLTINVWNKAGSKGSWRKRADELLEGIAAMIATDPDVKWLIIHHLPRSIQFDLPKKLKAMAGVNPNNLQFLTWGRHFATNDYRDIPNVILAGTLFYPAPAIEALGMAAAHHPASQGEFPKEDQRRVELGEYCHDILQALCRGRARGCVDGSCPPSKAFIIANAKSGIPAVLGTIFPGATVADWKPKRKAAHITVAPLQGKPKDAFEYIAERLKMEGTDVVSFTEAANAVRYEKSNFRKRVRKHSAFIAALTENGIRESNDLSGFVLSLG